MQDQAHRFLVQKKKKSSNSAHNALTRHNSRTASCHNPHFVFRGYCLSSTPWTIFFIPKVLESSGACFSSRLHCHHLHHHLKHHKSGLSTIPMSNSDWYTFNPEKGRGLKLALHEYINGSRRICKSNNQAGRAGGQATTHQPTIHYKGQQIARACTRRHENPTPIKAQRKYVYNAFEIKACLGPNAPVLLPLHCHKQFI